MIKPYSGEESLLIFAYTQIYLGESLRLYSRGALAKFIDSYQQYISIPSIPGLQAFEVQVKAASYPNLFGVWSDEKLLGFILQTGKTRLQTSDFSDSITTEIRHYFYSK
ncbi:hypothetical protein ACFQ4L_01675 [Lapidilactobacillus mulanensis]|uniref:Uncharacterized protein n=1 Tax=Lapidilactobacillus mulanensis TaxID=2485999 RepID=A0ABW4DP01_9LACO|nr:hypothetical protein [Lapidilactobacillus mulanensis]